MLCANFPGIVSVECSSTLQASNPLGVTLRGKPGESLTARLFEGEVPGLPLCNPGGSGGREGEKIQSAWHGLVQDARRLASSLLQLSPDEIAVLRSIYRIPRGWDNRGYVRE